MMRHLFKAAIGLMLAVSAGNPALAGEAPVLRSQVMTLSEIVTVGDFYSNAGEHASQPLFRSPDMGTSGEVDAEVVAERARAAGLKTAGTDGLRSVAVHRGATRFGHEQLTALVRNTLIGNSAGLDAESLEVNLLQAPDEILADPQVQNPIRIDRVDWSQTSGRFTIQAVAAVEHGRMPFTLYGTAVEMVDVVALAQPLRRGDILKEDDLATVRLARSKVPAGVVMDTAEVAGMQARTNLRANYPLSSRDFSASGADPPGRESHRGLRITGHETLLPGRSSGRRRQG
ncbi:flagella basal body P-ring formation protein FlgA [Roseibium salinum]|nr:flagella basal body P-ring formation protein FlgA [Roseibium salinum]